MTWQKKTRQNFYATLTVGLVSAPPLLYIFFFCYSEWSVDKYEGTIMDKRITRRVVLGTVIGGLVAAPFIMRSLKKQHKLPESEFAKEWRRALKESSLPVKDILHPNPFSTRFHLDEGRKLTFHNLSVNFCEGDIVESPSGETLPQWFSENESDFLVTKCSQNKVELDVTVDKSLVFRLDKGANDKSVERFSLVIDGGAVSSVAINGGESTRMPVFDLPGSCTAVISALYNQCPERESCKLGDSWQTPAIANGYEYPLTCSVVNFVEVNGRDAFELAVLHKQDVFVKSPLLEMLPDSSKFDAVRKQFQPLEFRYFHKEKRYVDIETGLTLFRVVYKHDEVRQTGTMSESSIDGYCVDRCSFI
ncbi:hypothetical protein FACS1894170_00820 [Planctomycetales bacterium]|nr:hypothetical protein FACS1894170_00820 [Planctomycetales bacterium]